MRLTRSGWLRSATLRGPDTFDHPSGCSGTGWRCGDVDQCDRMCRRAEVQCSSRMLRLDSGHNKKCDAPCVGSARIHSRTHGPAPPMGDRHARGPRRRCGATTRVLPGSERAACRRRAARGVRSGPQRRRRGFAGPSDRRRLLGVARRTPRSRRVRRPGGDPRGRRRVGGGYSARRGSPVSTATPLMSFWTPTAPFTNSWRCASTRSRPHRRTYSSRVRTGLKRKRQPGAPPPRW